jgi:hypothetical protein
MGTLKGHINKVRRSVIIETQKSPEEIRNIILNKTDKVNFWSITVPPKSKFFHKVDGNLIHLLPAGLLYWPFTELELNEFIEPRLKLNFSGFGLYLTIYILLFIPVLIGASELEGENDIIKYTFVLIIFGAIPVYANFIQRNTKNWVIRTLNE